MALLVFPTVIGDLGPLTKNICVVQSSVPIASITPEMLESAGLKVGDTVYITDSANQTSLKSIGAGGIFINPPIGITVEDVLSSISTTNALSANQGRVLSDAKLAIADKAIGAYVTAGTDDSRYVTSKAIADSDVLKKTHVVDNLTSTITDVPLSANQGKILDDSKLNKSEASYLIKSIHTKLLSANISKTPSGNSVSLPELNLEIDVLQGDILEVSSFLAADYASLKDIGDAFNIKYKIGSGQPQNTIALGKIIDRVISDWTGVGNLYTPIQINTSGTVTLSFSITTKNNSARTFLKNHCGIFAKLLRAPN